MIDLNNNSNFWLNFDKFLKTFDKLFEKTSTHTYKCQAKEKFYKQVPRKLKVKKAWFEKNGLHIITYEEKHLVFKDCYLSDIKW